MRQQESLAGPLDIYFMFDRTGSTGPDCDDPYELGSDADNNSKGCFATYAINDYFINVEPLVDTRLALQFLSLEGDDDNDCEGTAYAVPAVPLTQLPVAEDHALVTAIDEQDFDYDGPPNDPNPYTDTEGALNGIALYTAANVTPRREMIGVLMTDGDPNDTIVGDLGDVGHAQQCTEDVDDLAEIIANHLAATGIRTFIVGMDGATEENLEAWGIAGGAEPHDDYCGDIGPPCHYWNVGDGSGEAIADALQAIASQASPLPCEYPIDDIASAADGNLDRSTLNVRLSQPGEETVIVNVPGEASCPSDQHAWYYDAANASSATEVVLCPDTCEV